MDLGSKQKDPESESYLFGSSKQEGEPVQRGAFFPIIDLN
jgi:hypothetical protein